MQRIHMAEDGILGRNNHNVENRTVNAVIILRRERWKTSGLVWTGRMR